MLECRLFRWALLRAEQGWGGQTAEQGVGARQARTAVKGVDHGPNGQRVVVLLPVNPVKLAGLDGVVKKSRANPPSCSLGVHVEDSHVVAVVRVGCSSVELLEEDFVSLHSKSG